MKAPSAKWPKVNHAELFCSASSFGLNKVKAAILTLRLVRLALSPKTALSGSRVGAPHPRINHPCRSVGIPYGNTVIEFWKEEQALCRGGLELFSNSCFRALADAMPNIRRSRKEAL